LHDARQATPDLRYSSARRSGSETKRCHQGWRGARPTGGRSGRRRCRVRSRDRPLQRPADRYPVSDQQGGGFAHGGILVDRHDVLRHYIGRTHAPILFEDRNARVTPWALSRSTRTTRAAVRSTASSPLLSPSRSPHE